jgi:hypothetical protein
MPVLATTSYRITDLSTLPGGTQSVAHGLNAVGWVVGTADAGLLARPACRRASTERRGKASTRKRAG